MSIRKRDICLFFATLCIAGVTVVAALQGKSIPPANQEQQEDFSQYPIADATAPKPTDPKKIAKIKAKSRKYAQYKNFGAGPGIKGSTLYHWGPDFPELPVAQSDAVVFGTVAEARAQLTEDESNVYSEFTINVKEVLKNDSQQLIFPGDSIIVDRPGGRVKYGTGQTGLFWIQGFGMPRKGGQYVLFIKRGGLEEYDIWRGYEPVPKRPAVVPTADLDEDYQIITGYEIRQGRVYPLDRATGNVTNFGIYTNWEEATFLNKIRSAISQ